MDIKNFRNIKTEAKVTCCFVCGSSVDNNTPKLFSFVPKHSKQPMAKLLQQVMCQTADKLFNKNEMNESTNHLCKMCSDQLNQYDYGIWLAKRSQEVLQKAFKDKYGKISTNDPSPTKAYDTPMNVTKEETIGFSDDDINSNDASDFKTEGEGSVYSDDSEAAEVIEISIVSEEEGDNDEEEKGDGGTSSVKKEQRTFAIHGPSKSYKKPGEKRKYQRKKDSELDCRLCGLRFNTLAEIQEHNTSHDGLDPLQCPICQKHFHKKGALVVHMSIHTGEKKYVCSLCGKAYIHYASFHIHTLAHNNIREKKCEICGRLFYSNSHLNRHMRVHSGAKPYKCDHCGREFAQRYNLTVHQKAHDGIQVVRKRKITAVEPL